MKTVVMSGKSNSCSYTGSRMNYVDNVALLYSNNNTVNMDNDDSRSISNYLHNNHDTKHLCPNESYHQNHELMIANATCVLFGTQHQQLPEHRTPSHRSKTTYGNADDACTNDTISNYEHQQYYDTSFYYDNDHNDYRTTTNKRSNSNILQRLHQLHEYFFGFMMMQERYEHDEEYDNSDTDENNYDNNRNKQNDLYNRNGSNGLLRDNELEYSDDHMLYDNRPLPSSSSSSTTTAALPVPSIVMALSSFYLLQSMATIMIQCTVIPSIGYHLLYDGDHTYELDNNNSYPNGTSTTTTTTTTMAVTSFVQQTISISMFGIAFGKLINGPIIDIIGARRILLSYTVLLAWLVLSLAILSSTIRYSSTTTITITRLVHGIAFMIEFLSSIQWPCIAVVLATHFRRSSRHHHLPSNSKYNTRNYPNRLYENGIFITSIASRIGSIMGIIISSYMIQYYGRDNYVIVIYISTWLITIAISIIYLYIYDAQYIKYQPPNPIDMNLLLKWFPEFSTYNTDRNHRSFSIKSLYRYCTINKGLRVLLYIIQTNIIPSLRHIFGSMTFWIITCSHTGTSMVRTSQKLLPSYFVATSSSSSSSSVLSYETATSYSMYHSTGTALGLLIGGTIYIRYCNTERQRKYFITKLYMLSIVSCYILCLLSIPYVHNFIIQVVSTSSSSSDNEQIIQQIQIISILILNFGVAIQLYHIPSIVGASYGCDKGLFLSYNDGIAYLFVAFIWRYVVHYYTSNTTIDSNHNNNNSVGWAYGWAAVALSLIVSGLLMIEFMEYYFCRPSLLRQQRANANTDTGSTTTSGGTYETIIFV